MEYQTPKSKCNICQLKFTGRGLTKHIRSCLEKHLLKDGKTKNLFYFQVKDSFNPDYFLHLLISEDATLGDFDFFLRKIWLECCGHLSAFSHERYGQEIDMRKKIKDVFSPGMELIHQYDFGSTTELCVTAICNYHGAIDEGMEIQIIARNAEPIIPCDECNENHSVVICTECAWDEVGWLCDKCAQDHKCGDDMFLPVVNSPRVGVCAYTGDAEDIYCDY